MSTLTLYDHWAWPTAVDASPTKYLFWWILDPDWRRLERRDVRWDNGVRRPVLFWDDRVLLLHHPLHLRKLYPLSQRQTYLKTAEVANLSANVHLTSERKYKAMLLSIELSFTEHLAQISSWMCSWLSLWTTWQTQSLSTQMEETIKGDSLISTLSLCEKKLSFSCPNSLIHNTMYVHCRDKKDDEKDEKVSLILVTYLYSMRS